MQSLLHTCMYTVLEMTKIYYDIIANVGDNGYSMFSNFDAQKYNLGTKHNNDCNFIEKCLYRNIFCRLLTFTQYYYGF